MSKGASFKSKRTLVSIQKRGCEREKNGRGFVACPGVDLFEPSGQSKSLHLCRQLPQQQRMGNADMVLVEGGGNPVVALLSSWTRPGADAPANVWFPAMPQGVWKCACV